jgi:hypothetical protein
MFVGGGADRINFGGGRGWTLERGAGAERGAGVERGGILRHFYYVGVGNQINSSKKEIIPILIAAPTLAGGAVGDAPVKTSGHTCTLSGKGL